MGRIKKPATIHKAQGTYREDRHADGGLTPAFAIPLPPKWLRGKAVKFWAPVVDMLASLGVTAYEYSAGLALLMDALADWVDLMDECDGETFVLYTSEGKAYPNPLMLLKDAAWKRAMNAVREHGATPASIRSVKANDKNPKAAPQARSFAGEEKPTTLPAVSPRAFA